MNSQAETLRPDPLTPDEVRRRIDEAHAFGYREGHRAALRAATPTPAEPGLDAERLALAMHYAMSSAPGLGDRPELWRSAAKTAAAEYARLATPEAGK